MTTSTPETVYPGPVRVLFISSLEEKIGDVPTLREAIDPDGKYKNGVFAYLGQGAGNLAVSHLKLIKGQEGLDFDVKPHPDKPNGELCYLCPISQPDNGFNDKLDQAIKTANAYIGALGGTNYLPPRSTENF